LFDLLADSDTNKGRNDENEPPCISPTSDRYQAVANVPA
jgi:hypothetical protein